MRLLVLMMVAVLPVGCKKGRQPGDKATAVGTDRLKQIGLAMHNHNDTYGTLPAGVYTTDNRVGLSWRVQLLPYLENDSLYRQFKLDEPWDSPRNRPLLDQMPEVFATPGAKTAAGHTFVRGFAATAGLTVAMFPNPLEKAATSRPPGSPVAGRRLSAITDGTSNSIMLVEATEAVPWTMPEALAYDPQQPVPPLGAVPGPYLVLMGDGAVRLFQPNMPEATLRLLITINDGQTIPADDPVWGGR